jgi:hypothetical protein
MRYAPIPSEGQTGARQVQTGEATIMIVNVSGVQGCDTESKFRRGERRWLNSGLLATIVIACIADAGPATAQPRQEQSIVLARQGAFEAGGTVRSDEKGTLSCDHGYVEYQIPVKARAVSLVMWHSSAAKVWQNRWDGGEGYQSIFLRRGFPVYLWDGPRVGRGNWGCENYTFKSETGRDQQNFVAWRLGAKYLEWFPGVQFPTNDPKAWDQATRARYDEFDTVKNAQLETDAAAKAIDQIGPSVLVTNSAGGWRAMLTALKTKSDNIKAIVAYENPGYIFPEGQGPQLEPGPFGPVYVPMSEFKKLTRIPIQFVWGDNIEKSPVWTKYLGWCKQFVALVNANGGHAEILQLPSVGLKGNTHIAFADLNNVAVADQLSAFLRRNKLDLRAAASGKAKR